MSDARLVDVTELVRRWQLGWSECRGLDTPEEARGGLHFLLRKPGRHREIVVLHADDDPASVAALAEEVAAYGEPTWLTVPTHRPDEVSRVARAAGLEIRSDCESLMTRELAGHPVLAVEDLVPGEAGPYRSVVEADGRVLAAEVLDESGAVAARGWASFVDGDAVPDRIETEPAHRRRGLGRVVMGALTSEAFARGARTGILIASKEGERLYTTLGWTTRATVVIAINRVG